MAGGRPKGSLNKATKDIKALAQEYVPSALKELARIATKGKSESARVAAIKELLDRGFGKAHQVIAGDRDNPLQLVITNEESEL